MSAPNLSVIVPAGSGDRAWKALWPDLPGGDAVERILVIADGDTIDHAPAFTTVLSASRGRARQINAGWRAAQAEVVWLLHADSRVDADTVASALRTATTLARTDQAMLGYFDLAFFDGPPLMAINALGANLRSRVFGMPFGDQGFLAPRRVFETLGGFDESIARGEDHALVWAAHRAGIPLRRLPGRVATSARRYAEHGWWRTTREHLALTWRQRRLFARPESS
jgi:hypothetical protein